MGGRDARSLRPDEVPIGATHAAHGAQSITWALLEPIQKLLVDLVTMIDNVIIASDDEDEFARAVQTFVERCNADDIPLTREDILRAASNFASSWTSILGEEYKDDLVRNTEKCTSHLRAP